MKDLKTNAIYVNNKKKMSTEGEEKRVDDTQIAIGKKIKLFRQLKGFNQSDIASQLGITFQQFQKYESGKNRIPVSRLMKLAEIFGVKVATFFENAVNVMFQDIEIKSSNKLNENIMPIEIESAKHKFNVSDEEMTTLIKSFRMIEDAGVRNNILKLVKSLSEQNN